MGLPDVFRRIAAALHSDFVDGAHFGRVAISNHEGGNVLHDFGAASQKGMTADTAKLMNGRQSANDGIIFNVNMAGEGCVVTHYDVAANGAFVGDMGVGEKQVVIADDGAAFLCSGRVDGAKFTEYVAGANFQGGVAAGVFQVLRFAADQSVGKNFAFRPEGGVALHGGMVVDPRGGAEARPGPDIGIGADRYAIVNLGAFFDKCGRMYLGSQWRDAGFRCQETGCWILDAG